LGYKKSCDGIGSDDSAGHDGLERGDHPAVDRKVIGKLTPSVFRT
jgi:hypothetical protein